MLQGTAKKRNSESLFCSSATYILLFINYNSIKKEEEQFRKIFTAPVTKG